MSHAFPSQTSPCRASAPRNTLGIVGFIFSLLGVLSCGLIAPLGLVLSLLAMLKRPRGLAAAGAVIGGLASLGLLAIALGLIATFDRVQPALAQMTDECKQAQATLAQAVQASQELDSYKELHGDWPDQTLGQEIVGKYQDAHGTTLRYTRVAEMVLIVSAGADLEFATPDDVSLDPVSMTINQPEPAASR